MTSPAGCYREGFQTSLRWSSASSGCTERSCSPNGDRGMPIILLASLLLMGVPVIHMRGAGVGFGTTRSGGFFFIWTLLTLGVTALFSVILSVRGLWSLRRGR